MGVNQGILQLHNGRQLKPGNSRFYVHLGETNSFGAELEAQHVV